MPKKSNSSNSKIITAIKRLEKSLKSDLEKSFTSKIKDLEKSFTCKLEDTELALMVRIEERAEKTERVLREEIRDTRNDLMTKIDGIAKGVDDLRTENTFGSNQIEELRDRADDHEERITKLESPQAV